MERMGLPNRRGQRDREHLAAKAEALSPAQIDAIARGREKMERGSERVFRVLSELTAR